MESTARSLHRVSMCINIQAELRSSLPASIFHVYSCIISSASGIFLYCYSLLSFLIDFAFFFFFPPLEYSNFFHLCSSEVSFASSLIALSHIRFPPRVWYHCITIFFCLWYLCSQLKIFSKTSKCHMQPCQRGKYGMNSCSVFAGVS